MDRNNKKKNTTQYGEFISSFFSWITPTNQKKRAEELENISKKDVNNDRNK